MKNLFLVTLLAFGALFTSCNGDDDSGPEETFVATIDGNSFEASIVTALEDNTLGESVVFISGEETSSGNIIGLNIPLSTAVGSSMSIDETDFALTFTDADENAYFTVGQITLDEIDAENKTISGTFSFDATDSADATNIKEITGGEFRVIYQ